MSATEPKSRRTAGAFDIRMVIAALIGLYGLVLTGLGIFDASDAELSRADGLNVNLWAGIGMLVVSAAFVCWTLLRPIVVPAETSEPPDEGAGR